MAKEISKVVKLQVKGGAANPSPPVGPALGAAGVNIMEFCKQFNARTQDQPEFLPEFVRKKETSQVGGSHRMSRTAEAKSAP